MFNNVGKKIQSVSIFSAWLGIICGVVIAIFGIPMIVEGMEYKYIGEEEIILGVTCIVLGIAIALISYLSSLFLCAFGKLVDDISSIKYSIDNKVIYNNIKMNEINDDNSESLPEL